MRTVYEAVPASVIQFDNRVRVCPDQYQERTLLAAAVGYEHAAVGQKRCA
jgi:hypothetical protein